MTLQKRLGKIILSYDFIISLTLAIGIRIALCNDISLIFARDLYSTAISIFSIMFSVYFAAIAIMSSSNDNEFAKYLIKEGLYTEIVWTQRYTLYTILVSLLTAFIFYGICAYKLGDVPESNKHLYTFSRDQLVVSIAILTYGLLAAFSVASDAIRYAHYRSAFLDVTENKAASVPQQRKTKKKK